MKFDIKSRYFFRPSRSSHTYRRYLYILLYINITFDLTAHTESRISTFSGGELQRVMNPPLSSFCTSPPLGPSKSKTKASLSSNFILFTLWCCGREFKKIQMSKRTRTTTAASSSKGSKKPRILPPSPHGPFWNGTTTDPEIIAVLKSRRDGRYNK